MKRILGDGFAVFGSLAVLAYLLKRHSGFFHDDAYITLRYALNFAETGLIQWNPGEWAEGYTSLLHVVLTGWVIRLGVSAVAAAQLVNATAAFVLLVMVSIAARAVLPGRENRLARGLTVLTVAGSTPIVLWVLGGLEAVVVAAFLASGVAALLSYLRQPRPALLVLAATAYALAILTRLDASVFIAGSGLGLLMTGSETKSARLKAVAIVVGIPAVVSFIQMGIRWQIYGELFPLTFYAKADLPLSEKLLNGAQYLFDMLVAIPTLGVALGVVVILRKSARSNPFLTFLLCATVLQLLYILWAGGDHMPWARMLVPLLAPLVLSLLASLSEMELRTRNLVVGASAAAALVMALVEPPKARDHAAHFGEIVGHHIDNTWPEGITIALNTAGSTPFFARQNRSFIDMLGLNDPVIAKRENVPLLTERQSWPGHAKGDGAYVLSRAPDRIIIGPAHGVDVADAWFLSGKELESLPEFARCYQQVIEPVHYSKELAARGEEAPNPLRLLYYIRVCP